MIKNGIFQLLIKITFVLLLSASYAMAKGIVIDWYEPNFLGPDKKNFIKVSVAGQTEPGAQVQIDLSKIIIIRSPLKNKKLPSETAIGIAGGDGFFEFETRFPVGLLQVPVLVKGSEKQNILVLFDVDEKTVKLNAKTKKRPSKPEKEVLPPELAVAAGKPVRAKETKPTPQGPKIENYTFWLGAGGNFQRLGQKQVGSNDLSFQNLQFVSLFSQLRYDGASFATSIGYQTHPTSITQAVAPLTLQNTKANWSILDLSMWWKFSSGKIRLGVESHQIPFISVNQSNQVNLIDNSMFGVALGYGLSAGDLQSWLIDFGISYVYPISYDSAALNAFSLLPKNGLEVDLEISKSMSERLILGLQWITIMQNHGYTYKDSTSPTIYNGDLNLLLSTVFLELGYRF